MSAEDRYYCILNIGYITDVYVNLSTLYIERNNMQVKLIRLRKQILNSRLLSRSEEFNEVSLATIYSCYQIR